MPLPCRKHVHKTREQAIDHIVRMRRQGDQRQINVYRCPHCGAWHVGHDSKRTRREMRNELDRRTLDEGRYEAPGEDGRYEPL